MFYRCYLSTIILKNGWYIFVEKPLVCLLAQDGDGDGNGDGTALARDVLSLYPDDLNVPRARKQSASKT